MYFFRFLNNFSQTKKDNVGNLLDRNVFMTVQFIFNFALIMIDSKRLDFSYFFFLNSQSNNLFLFKIYTFNIMDFYLEF